MKSICSNVVQDDELISELLHVPYGRVRISKLITEQGVESGFDDMIELLTVEEPEVRRVHGGGDKYLYNRNSTSCLRRFKN